MSADRYRWIACDNAMGDRSTHPGARCSARAAFLVVAGYEAGRHVCGTHARAFNENALQRIQYPPVTR